MAGEAALGAVLAVATATALAAKWQLGIRRAALTAALLAVPPAVGVTLLHRPPGGAATAVALTWLATMVLAAVVVAQRFYRDPDRTPPDRDDVVVSPADGEVIYVRRSSQGRLPAPSKLTRDYTLEELTRTPLHEGDALVVGIALSFLDVHVNRSPIRGRIALQRHHPGRFASLRRPAAVFENERATIVIERDGFQLAVVMIASRLVRRIVTFLAEGQQVALGQRIGIIRFGSQVDLVIPARRGAIIHIRPGDHVVGGQTIVATGSIPGSGSPPLATSSDESAQDALV
jgi:phosphatidylserine decarboxylase